MTLIKKFLNVVLSLVCVLSVLVINAGTEEAKLTRANMDPGIDKKRTRGQSSSTILSNWPMHQYNAQHTGYNNNSTISLPLGLRWSLNDTLIKVNQVTAVGDRILITYAYGGQFRIACLDSKDGSVLWLWYLGGGNDVAQASYGYGNAYVQVMYHANSYMAAFDMNSGDSLWLTRFSAQWDYYLAPTVHQGKVLYGAGTYGGAWCNDAFTGEVLWKTLGTSSEWHTPAAHRDTVYMFIEQVFWVGDLMTGSKIWSINADTIVRAKTNGQREVLNEQMGVSPVIDTVNKIAYCMDAFWHYLYAIDLKERQMLWIDSLIPHGYGKTPALYGDYLYVTHWGYMQVYDRFTGEKLWSFAGDDSLRFAPVIANGYLFVGSLRNTFALDVNTHQVLWTYPVGGQLTVSDKHLFVADSAWHNLYAFGDFTTDVEDEVGILLPKDFSLNQNYPNPFNPTTQIEFSIPRRSQVEIVVYNSIGQQIKTLIRKELSAGSHKVNWDGKDNIGESAPSGVYFYKMTAGEFTDSKKMILLK